jgi:hypothetical protein
VRQQAVANLAASRLTPRRGENMFNLLDSVEFKQIIWIIPIILLLHELEEWNIRSWHIKNSMDVPGETFLSTRMWILFLSLFGFLWTALAFLIPNNSISAGVMFALVCFTLLNALQHLIGLLRFRQYNPGFFFSTIFGFPTGFYIAYRILAQNLLPLWVILVFGILTLVSLVFTIKMIHFINRIGIKLANWISN